MNGCITTGGTVISPGAGVTATGISTALARQTQNIGVPYRSVFFAVKVKISSVLYCKVNVIILVLLVIYYYVDAWLKNGAIIFRSSEAPFAIEEIINVIDRVIGKISGAASNFKDLFHDDILEFYLFNAQSFSRQPVSQHYFVPLDDIFRFKSYLLRYRRNVSNSNVLQFRPIDSFGFSNADPADIARNVSQGGNGLRPDAVTTHGHW
jgi:hypothetical protein